MTVKTKLLINIFSWMSFFLILIIVLDTATTKVGESIQIGSLADRMLVGASDMSTITYDYLIHPEERTKQQWELRHASLGKLIQEMQFRFSTGHNLEHIKLSHRKMLFLFWQLTEMQSKLKDPQESKSLIEENSQRITAGLVACAQMMVSDVFMLTSEIDEEIHKVQSSYVGYLYLSLAVITMLAISISFFTAKNIASSIQTLKEGTEKLASGNLEYRVPVKGRDEIAALSGAFNQMAQRLRASYTSLEKEIQNKEQAQKETRAAYSGMELRVEERTREITIMNRELKQSEEKLKSTVQELQSFSYSVSHDLRAPLRAIDGFASMLEKDLGGKPDPEVQRKLTVIKENVRNMGQLIDDLLALSRLGRKQMALSDIDMGHIFDTVWQELRVINPGLKIEFYKKGFPPTYGDYALIKQVVFNLLSNAVKFTGSQERPLIEIGGTEEDDEGIYYVKDNGAGFDMHYYDKLFNVFQRLHSTAEYEGTGIGLAIVQRIIHRHGGRVWAHGEVGKGATFYFSLPVKKNRIDFQGDEDNSN